MFLYIATIIVTILILYVVSSRIECFTDVPLLVYNIARSPHNINIITDVGKHDIKPLRKIDHIFINSKIKCNDCNLYVSNFHSVFNSKSLKKLVAVLPTESSFVFVKQRNTFHGETMEDVFRRRETIGYYDEDHKHLISCISSALGMLETPRMRKLKRDSDKGMDNVYCIFFFQEIEHENIKLSKDIVPDVLDIGNIDINILKVHLPYVIPKNKDFGKYVNNYTDRYSIKTTFVVENVLIGDRSFDEGKYRRIINDIHGILADTPKMNYYGMFAHEKFTQPIDININIDGFYDSHKQTLTVHSVMNKLGLVENMILNLKQQEREEENGLYILSSHDPKISILTKVSALKNKGIVEDAYRNKYVCVGDNTKKTKWDCEKNPRNLWDRPCQINKDCPYYQQNKNYKNYRGGCIDGKCEMPLGVVSRGFRHIDERSVPVCHGCLPSSKECCRKTNNDYAFPLDFFERS